MSSPTTALVMASRWIVVMRGISAPLEVELTSSMDEALAGVPEELILTPCALTVQVRMTKNTVKHIVKRGKKIFHIPTRLYSLSSTINKQPRPLTYYLIKYPIYFSEPLIAFRYQLKDLSHTIYSSDVYPANTFSIYLFSLQTWYELEPSMP